MRVSYLGVFLHEPPQDFNALFAIAGVNQGQTNRVGHLWVLDAAVQDRCQYFQRARAVRMEQAAHSPQNAYLLAVRLAGNGLFHRRSAAPGPWIFTLGQTRHERPSWN